MTTVRIFDCLPFIGSLVLIIVASYHLVFRVLYKQRIKGIADTHLLNSGPLSTSVRMFVNRFDSEIGFVVSEDHLSLAEAASFGPRPAYIVFSKQLLEHSSGEHSYFDDNDLISLAAHELGHIIPKSRLQLFIIIMISAFMLVISMTLWVRMIALLLLLVPLLMWLGFISREEEYRADSFAINEAGISVQQFAKTLIKCNEFLNAQRLSAKKPSNNIIDRVIKLFFISHPSIEHRISRLQTLYEKPPA